MNYKERIKGIPFGIRLEKYRDFFQKKNFKSFLEETETWSAEQVRDWQLMRLKEIVDYAYMHVPLYRHIYSAAGYSLGEIRSLSDFCSLPTISKADIKKI